ncbi:MAG: hypothetical protein FD180_2405 [Planctomycetota bacterium]|nr:MAG: hypothetical protein FD180_2405 [Planctomycetota bacterium]
MEHLDIGVFVVGALGVLSFLVYVHTLCCPKCRRFEIVDHGRYCRFCGDDLDTITGSFKWIAPLSLFVLPLAAATMTLGLLFDRPQYAFWSFGIMFMVLLLRNIVLRVAFGCENCGASQLVTRKNLMAQKHCSHCGERI